MRKISIIIFLFGLVITCSIILLNHLSVTNPVDNSIAEDPRNDGIEFSAHYQFYINPSILVLNLQAINKDKAPIDIFRTLLQASYALKDKDFSEVLLQYKGQSKFKLQGSYFKKLGTEYKTQNPMYTIRTFPENVSNLNGTPAFESISGGFLGVLEGQMDQFSEFTKAWYLTELTSSN